jgi:FKBP-type peptidyl-prolyl cis-trans isomerase 2
MQHGDKRMAKIKEGDFIRISFTLKVKDTDQLLEVTNEEEAKKANIFDEKNNYGPRLMIVGNEEMFLKRVNETVIGKEVGDTLTVEVPPEETFGYKDASKIKVLGRRELVAKDIMPAVGKQITWGKQTGIIKNVVGGRVRVDFNHPLVGQTIVYEIEIKEQITSTKKKIEALIDYRMPGIDLSNFSIETEKEGIKITLPEDIVTKDPYLQLRKIRIASDINMHLPKFTQITYIESFTFDESTK